LIGFLGCVSYAQQQFAGPGDGTKWEYFETVTDTGSGEVDINLLTIERRGDTIIDGVQYFKLFYSRKDEFQQVTPLGVKLMYKEDGTAYRYSNQGIISLVYRFNDVTYLMFNNFSEIVGMNLIDVKLNKYNDEWLKDYVWESNCGTQQITFNERFGTWNHLVADLPERACDFEPQNLFEYHYTLCFYEDEDFGEISFCHAVNTNEVETINSVVVYPNPINVGNPLTIEGDVNGYEIYNILGQRLRMGTMFNTNTINLNQPSGWYTLVLYKNDTRVDIKKILVQ
jgi:hypothetical protein